MAAPLAAAAGIGFPWLTAASLAAGPLMQSLFPKEFGGQTEYKGLNPEDYKKDIVMDEGDLGGIRQGILSNIQKSVVQPGVRGIKQAGAARRMPLGSIKSATEGIVSTGAKGVAEAEPGLQNMKRQSMMDFLNMKSRYEYDKNMFDFAGTQQSASMNQGAMGGLSKLLMLWQAGALDRPETAAMAA